METYKLTILTASSGKYLTNGEIICTSVQLAPSASPDDWREVTDAEKEEIERKLEEDTQRELAE